MPYRRLLYLLAVALAVLVCRAPAAEAPAAVAPASEELVRVADEVAKEVEALRGWPFKTPVAKRFCTPEDVRRYLQEEIEEGYPPEKILRIQAFLRTVGLLPPDGDLRKTFLDLLEEQVGGFYDSDSKTLRLVERGSKMPEVVLRIMLAHELTHALDDQHVDLRAFLKPLTGKTEDMDLVAQAVVEGSATSLMTQYMARLQMSGGANMADLQQYALDEMERSKTLAAAPRYFTAMLGGYLCGMQFLAKGNLLAAVLAPDNKAVGENFLAAVKDPPRSTEQILHPEKYWNPQARDEPVLVDDEAAAKLLQAPGRWVVHADTVGEMLCAILTTPAGADRNLLTMQMADAWTNEAAKGWGGDRFYLLSAGPNAEAAAKTLQDTRGVWLTLWDTPADRDEFLQAYQANRPPSAPALLPLGTMGAVALYGFTEAEQAAVRERLEKSPLPMTRGGKPWTPWTL